MKTAYQHLQDMSSDSFIAKQVKHNNKFKNTKPSKRFAFIQSKFRKGQFDEFTADGLVGRNFYRFIDVKAPTTIVFLAHHDVVVLNQQNCNDNTASVCQVIELAHKFSKNRKQLKHNVVCAFVDYEEKCSTLTAGSTQLAKQIKSNAFGNVVAVINLELTAVGKYFWMKPEGPNVELISHLEQNKFEQVTCPINDAVHLNRNGVSAICVGNFREEDRKIVVGQRRSGCELWMSCHSQKDTMEIWANESDMTEFNKVLFKLATKYKGKSTAVYDANKTYSYAKRDYSPQRNVTTQLTLRPNVGNMYSVA